MSLRTKFILTAVIAFSLGMLFRGGSGTVGRYQFHPSSPTYVIDTATGDTFQYSADTQGFKRLGSLPWH